MGGDIFVPVTTPASDEQRHAWSDDGWCVIEAAIPSADIDAASEALSRMFPTAAEMDSGIENESTAKWRVWDTSWPEFPFRSSSLNRIAMHHVVLDLAEDFLCSDDIRLYMGLITAKYANQSSHFNQLLHTDYPNHMIVVPRDEVAYRQLELFIYLTDVTAENGATRMVSVRKTAGIPVESHTLDLTNYSDLYEEPGEASGPAGSIVCYRPDVYHRSTDWSDPGMRRIMMHLSFRPAGAEWGGYHAWPYKGLSPDWHNYVNRQAGPRELGLLGFPRPGHPYWTPQTLDGVSARYPGLDMTPWRDAFVA
jgi:ectoine hydroxylase-related dioxygenase (phytanoyl-CoA dioxygenase family)